MSQTKRSTRIATFIGALVFFVSSAGLTIAVVWDMVANKDKDSASVQDAKIEEQSQAEQPANENALKGKQLEGFTAIAEVPELQVVDQQVGTGVEAKAGDTVTAHYTGAIAATGVVFESSKDSGNPATFPLANVIQGWQEGVPGMKEGGKRRLIIPADKAYGANPPQGSDIPANAALVFDIELVKVGQ